MVVRAVLQYYNSQHMHTYTNTSIPPVEFAGTLNLCYPQIMRSEASLGIIYTLFITTE